MIIVRQGQIFYATFPVGQAKESLPRGYQGRFICRPSCVILSLYVVKAIFMIYEMVCSFFFW